MSDANKFAPANLPKRSFQYKEAAHPFAMLNYIQSRYAIANLLQKLKKASILNANSKRMRELLGMTRCTIVASRLTKNSLGDDVLRGSNLNQWWACKENNC